MKRTASAVWQGTLKEGSGTVSMQSGVLKDTPYSFRSRFGDGTETNPEELIAAAHAGCFTMALSLVLGNAGFPAERLATTATLSLDQVAGRWIISTVHLDLTAKVPGIDREDFEAAAEEAKQNCPVSQVLKATITLKATLEA
jgi:lipoyl-dependent peroxiredoxin